MPQPIAFHAVESVTTSSSGDKSLIHIPALSNRPRYFWVVAQEITDTAPTYAAYLEFRVNATQGGSLNTVSSFINENSSQDESTQSTYYTYASADTGIDGTMVRKVAVLPRATKNIQPYCLKGGDTLEIWARQNTSAAITLLLDIWGTE